MIEIPNRRKEIVTETNNIGCQLVVSHVGNGDGHVSVRIDGVKYLLHRLVYEEFNGKIPEGLIIRHKCDNTNCINPEHLELGTHDDNVNDRVDRNRSAKGSDNGRSKLTEEQAKFIKYNDELKNSELANMFDISVKAVRNIKQGKSWKHV
jgi:hypothetical protein